MGLRVDKRRMLNIRLEQLEVEGSKHNKEYH
jgi:regulator of PEP synthase PpsR (kinase-PPPase family)